MRRWEYIDMEGISSWIDENYGNSSEKKTVSYRTLCFCLAFASVWMFLLGMSVGRNTCPVRFDTKPIMTQLAQWIESETLKQKEYAQMVNSQDNKLEIDLEALKNANIDLIPHTHTKKQAQSELNVKPENNLITKRSTKKRTRGTFSLSTQMDKAKLSDYVTLQTAALKDSHAAVEMAKKLKRMGFPAYTASINLPKKGLWYRVRVGTFSSVQNARKMKDSLQKMNIDSIIVPFVRGDDYNFANAKDHLVNPES
jgi:cell division septation protein DedD